MRYLIKQKSLSWSNSFTIKDDQGNDCFHVDGKAWWMGKTLTLTDMVGVELAQVTGRVSWTPTYDIFQDGVKIAEAVQKIGLTKSTMQIAGPEWTATWGWKANEIEISDMDGCVLARASADLMSWMATSYSVDIMEEDHTVLLLCAFLTIDAALESVKGGAVLAAGAAALIP